MALETTKALKVPNSREILDALRAVVGSEAIRTEGLAELVVDGQTPLVAVRPTDPKTVAAVLSTCVELGAAVVPRGAGSQMNLGSSPHAVHVVLETAGLNRIEAYNPADLTLGVQAGMRLADLQDHLRSEGQFLPVDPPFAEQATVGGLVATNTSGPRRMLAGSWRDLVIGAEVAGVDGRITKSGGMVVKNVTGYDVHKAHIGALGTLGVITRLNFKVMPLPKLERTLTVGFDDPLAATAAVGRLVDAPLSVSGIDLIEHSLVPGYSDSMPDWQLAVRASGTKAGIADQLEVVRGILELDGRGPTEILDGKSQTDLWSAATGLAEPPPGPSPHAICRFSAISSQVGSILGSAGELAALHGLFIQRAAHALSAVGRVRVSGHADDRPYVDFINAFRATAEHLGAAVVVESAPLAVKQSVGVWGMPTDCATLDMMRRLRRAFDPTGILNPGRFIVEPS